MFRASGIDLGRTATRAVSVGILWGTPSKEDSIPAGMPSVVGMPSEKLTFRTLSVPESNREIQGNVIREELTLSLPFAAEEASWDWAAQDGTAAVTIALNSDIKDIRRKINPDTVIDAEPLSYLRICRSIHINEALIFDFGAGHTSAYAVKSGNLDWIKVSFKGGESLTKEIAEKHNLSLEEAEAHKHALGTEEPICRQWLKDLAAANLLTNPIPFDKLFVCGGGAQMKGLQEELTALLGQEAQPLPMPEGLSPYSDAAAYGAALANKHSACRISLQEIEEDTVSLPWKYAVWLIILLTLGTVNLEMRAANADMSVKKQVASYQKAAKKVLPSLKNTAPEEYQKKLNDLTEKNISSALLSPDNILQNMAKLAKPLSNIPSMEIRRFEINGEAEIPAIAVGGQAKSVQQVEEFRKAVAESINSPEIIDNRKSRTDNTIFSIEGKLLQQ